MAKKTVKKAKAKKNIMDRVKTFEDACKIQNINPKKLPKFSKLKAKYRKRLIADMKLMIIHDTLNEGEEMDVTNHNKARYSNWFSVVKDAKSKSGFGFSHTCYVDWNADTDVGARLELKSRELTLYSGEQFPEIHIDHVV